MDLKEVRGLGPTAIANLRKAGIKTAEQLALIDTKRRKVQGVTGTRLVTMRRDAQRAIFQKTAKRLRYAASVAARQARRGAETLEAIARKGAEQALAAAKEAEAAAAEALAHAQSAAADLAEEAAGQAVRAREAAQRQLHLLQERLDGNAGKRGRVDKYWTLLKRAEDASRAAADRAIAAAQHAKQRAAAVVKDTVEETQEKGASLYRRLLGKLGPKGRAKRP